MVTIRLLGGHVSDQLPQQLFSRYHVAPDLFLPKLPGDLVFMYPAEQKHVFQHADASDLSDLDPQTVILRVGEAFVVLQTVFQQQRMVEKGGRMHRSGVAEQGGNAIRFHINIRFGGRDQASVGAEVFAGGSAYDHIRMPLHERELLFKPCRQRNIIGIHPCNVLPLCGG